MLFHHMFSELVNDVTAQINANGEYAVEFASDGVFMLAFVRFWRQDELCRVFLKRTGRLQAQTDAEICLLAVIMAAMSTTPKLISCTGCSVRTVQLMDLSPYSSFYVKSPPRFEELSLLKINASKEPKRFRACGLLLHFALPSSFAGRQPGAWLGVAVRQSYQRYVGPNFPIS